MRDLPPWIWIMIALSTGGGGSIIGSKFRIDPFTGSDSRLMEQRITHKLERLENEIRRDMPPVEFRRKIRLMERFLENHFDESHAKFHKYNPIEGHPPTGIFKAYEE